MYCKECCNYFSQCPCCKESFCPDCGKTEADLEEEEGEE